MQAVEGIYHNGVIKLLETPKKIRHSRVIVTFLEDGEAESETQRLIGSIEILDDEWELANQEFRKQFRQAIEKSGQEFNE